ncbi:G0/G1 switch protein 2 [Anabas testudineus]|uniref:G0/G1 switch 2 n=1 Tax=Anabas testudineus TaxID=64144 RepID=A0A7N6AXT0_ANATE|nr:G0/G1 switch protein 2 [Anabas testudineus]
MGRTLRRSPDLVRAFQLNNQHNMETIGEIIPFAKEMLNQRPNRSMLKMYMLGSTLAMLGVIGGMVEMVLLPFGDEETVEDEPVVLTVQKKRKKKQQKQQAVESHTTLVLPEVVDMLEIEENEAKAKRMVTARRRGSANRLHAS